MASSSELEDMMTSAVACMQRAYAPYSKFLVGACVRAEDGRTFSGCNVENVSYGLTLCAERTALVKAVSEGARRFTDMVVVCSLSTEPGFPCGACRQFMVEFGPGLKVHCITPDKKQCVTQTGEDLLPRAFTPSHLPTPSNQ